LFYQECGCHYSDNNADLYIHVLSAARDSKIIFIHSFM